MSRKRRKGNLGHDTTSSGHDQVLSTHTFKVLKKFYQQSVTVKIFNLICPFINLFNITFVLISYEFGVVKD